MKITVALVSIFALVSCSMVEKVFNKKEKVFIKVTLQEHQKYCGGAAPTPEQQKGTFKPLANQVYYFKNRIDQDLTKAKTDASGLVNLKMEPGKYQVFMADKIDLDFEKFYEKYQRNQENYENESEACFRTYYSLPTWEVEIKNDSTFTLTEEIGCYTGSNPCVKYTGPARP